MVLADRINQPTGGVDLQITVTHIAIDRQRDQAAQAVRHVVAVKASITGVGDHDDPTVDGVGPPTVLVHPGAHIDQLVSRCQRKHLTDLTISVTPQQDIAAGLRGTLLHPVGIATVHPDLGQENRPGGDRARSDGRGPGAEGGCGAHGSSWKAVLRAVERSRTMLPTGGGERSRRSRHTVRAHP